MEYWNDRFSREGEIWGQNPSITAIIALTLFQERKISTILVPGAGYGRNTKPFSDNGFEVLGIEISQKALTIAKKYDTKTQFIHDDVLNFSNLEKKFDSIYCFNLLHLFLKEKRIFFLKRCFDHLNPNGLVFFVVFSDNEKSFGKGKKIEENTFESKPRRPVHYFTEKDLKDHFKNFQIIKTGEIEEEEEHGEIGKHVHSLRYIFGKK